MEPTKLKYVKEVLSIQKHSFYSIEYFHGTSSTISDNNVQPTPINHYD